MVSQCKALSKTSQIMRYVMWTGQEEAEFCLQQQGAFTKQFYLANRYGHSFLKIIINI
jgi:hypothetical protein